MSSETSEELVQSLVDLFRTLLDETLIIAIANDRNLQNRSEYEDARSLLEALAGTAASEEASGFNPSGMSSAVENTDDGPNDDLSTTETTNSRQASKNRDSDTSSSDFASSTADSNYVMPQLTSFNGDTEESKIVQLQNLFMELKEYDIKYSLQKSNGDFQTALDDLLNVQNLKSTNQQSKGIDAFFRPDDEVGKKTKKQKKKKKKGRQASASEPQPERELDISVDQTKQMKRQDEVAYIADRLNLSFGEVWETYFRKHYSSGATTVEIMDKYVLLGITSQDKAGQQRAQELAAKYGNIPAKYMPTLVHLTGSVSQYSDDIAALLSQHFIKNPWKEKLTVSYTLKPLPDEIEGLELAASGKAANKNAKVASSATSKFSLGTHAAAYAQATEEAGRYHQARREASASASALYRRGASNPLYRQAAAAYADDAREHGRYAQQATSTAADHFVQGQSSANTIDLHGVYVRDGVRIALQRVQAWWTNLGEFRSQKARQQTFTVITGQGRHSAGGHSQLRKAVAAALLQDGWKMEVQTGSFVVNGRR
ncbi:hypothetical protein G7046_g5681 [Stylonectria norvegica]|nr:hypothetical protein G7046_g5681 [Stylonectria norvegica]